MCRGPGGGGLRRTDELRRRAAGHRDFGPCDRRAHGQPGVALRARAPGDHGQQILLLGRQPLQDLARPWPENTLPQRLRLRHEMPRVPLAERTHGGRVGALQEQALAHFADGLEHGNARPERRFGGAEKGLVAKGLDGVHGQGGVGKRREVDHGLGRVEEEPAVEHRGLLEGASLPVRQQPTGPLERADQRLASLGAGTRGDVEQVQAAVEVGDDPLERQVAQARGGEFQRERDALEPGADLRDRRRIRRPQRECRVGFARAVDEQAHRVDPLQLLQRRRPRRARAPSSRRRRERTHRKLAFPRNVKQRSRGHEQARFPRPPRPQAHRGRRGRDRALQPVEDEKQASVFEPGACRVRDIAAGQRRAQTCAVACDVRRVRASERSTSHAAKSGEAVRRVQGVRPPMPPAR